MDRPSAPPSAAPAAALLLVGCTFGCVGAVGGTAGPVVSPTGKVYEEGTPPTETRQSQTAALYLRRGRTQRALELAQEGVSSAPGNPVHYYLAGVAHVRLGQYEEADSMFTEAERIYPAYELEIEPAREAAWAQAFNAGTEAYVDGDVDRAIEAWRDATVMYDLRPKAHRNLASVLVEEDRYSEAIEVYREALAGLEERPATRVLEEEEVRARQEERREIEESLTRLLLREGRYAEAVPLLRRRLRADSASVQVRSDLARALTRLGRHEEADELYTSILSEEELEASELFNLGIALFRSGDYGKASDAFERLTELQPRSRDAWYNYANALFAAEAWEEFVAVGDRLLELDPLGENSGLIVARAHLESGDEATARELMERVEGAPVHVDQLQVQRSGSETTVRGRVVGNAAEPGTPLDLRFVFYGTDGVLGRETVTVPAPAPDEGRPFSVSIDARAQAYRYELAGRSGEGG